MKNIALTLIRIYQIAFSPFLGRNCRFQPSCSQYFYEAVGLYGILQGSLLAAKRVIRCHPWSGGGYDPVKVKN